MKKQFRWRKYMANNEIKAILDQDFEDLLRRLNVYDAVVAGTVHCAFCQDTISVSNISMVFPKNGEVCFCCDKKICTDKLLKQRGISE